MLVRCPFKLIGMIVSWTNELFSFNVISYYYIVVPLHTLPVPSQQFSNRTNHRPPTHIHTRLLQFSCLLLLSSYFYFKTNHFAERNLIESKASIFPDFLIW